VAELVSVIFVPGTTAPLGSFTTPRKDVLATWAAAIPTTRSDRMSVKTLRQRVTFPPKKKTLRRRGSAGFILSIGFFCVLARSIDYYPVKFSILDHCFCERKSSRTQEPGNLSP
jgi:hypothetical protein